MTHLPCCLTSVTFVGADAQMAASDGQLQARAHRWIGGITLYICFTTVETESIHAIWNLNPIKPRGIMGEELWTWESKFQIRCCNFRVFPDTDAQCLHWLTPQLKWTVTLWTFICLCGEPQSFVQMLTCWFWCVLNWSKTCSKTCINAAAAEEMRRFLQTSSSVRKRSSACWSQNGGQTSKFQIVWSQDVARWGFIAII